MAKKSKKKMEGAKPESGGATEEGKKARSTETAIIRAIRVTPEILAAAKEYKKAKGVSFYALGLEAIADRLTKEGFLKKADQ